MRRAALIYAVARFGLFVLAAALLWSVSSFAGHALNGLPLLLAAAVVSSVLGYLLFSRQRTQLAEAVQAKRDAKTAEIADRRARLESDS